MTRTAFLVAVLVVMSGCIVPDAGVTKSVRVLVTEDFGHDVWLDQVVHIDERGTVMDALRAMAQVETSHGGGFVESIDGRRSGFPDARVDWFFEVNGIHSPFGAAQVEPPSDAIIVWDRRAWDAGTAVPGLFVAWPRPWTLGWDGAAATVSIDSATEGPMAMAAADFVHQLSLDVADTDLADHTLDFRIGRIADHVGATDPIRHFVRDADDGLDILDGPTLHPPWAALLRVQPTKAADLGHTRTLILASDTDAIGMLTQRLLVDPPVAGFGYAVDATQTTAVPP